MWWDLDRAHKKCQSQTENVFQTSFFVLYFNEMALLCGVFSSPSVSLLPCFLVIHLLDTASLPPPWWDLLQAKHSAPGCAPKSSPEVESMKLDLNGYQKWMCMIKCRAQIDYQWLEWYHKSTVSTDAHSGSLETVDVGSISFRGLFSLCSTVIYQHCL